DRGRLHISAVCVGVAERLEQIDYLLAQHDRSAVEGGPWSGQDDEPARNWTNGGAEPDCPLIAIWLGDFNSEPDSAEHRRITGETPYHPAARYHGGFCNAANATKSALYTHEKIIAGQRRLRHLDHCFVSPVLAPRIHRVIAQNDAIGSDHHPLWIEMDLETPL
ncbi:MAG: endonuclease/exonuclease/phosphatase family protein, partial [Cypionkella sp.]